MNLYEVIQLLYESPHLFPPPKSFIKQLFCVSTSTPQENSECPLVPPHGVHMDIMHGHKKTFMCNLFVEYRHILLYKLLNIS